MKNKEEKKVFDAKNQLKKAVLGVGRMMGDGGWCVESPTSMKLPSKHSTT
jgi:hypothetical protein